ncbi:peptide/nickel transport system permease protein [Acetitomaculum ruminis DSM 5522]|uniref:Peptide/nickel transport system permease protein n=1 Tax=Acetitomaculum ruminis DSM 5522 TaxID=1120918 RepID=A0A1I0ZB51_9FIRM|nr:ABC transporter permease [Acetitomaculum ruminis]SFB22979.1 peptide/nickel transport system permease protein [Acetitomaculum ruminis DSM 5522]
MDKIKRNRDYIALFMAVFAAIVFILIATFSYKFAPNNPLATDYDNLLKAPCSQYFFGTDQLGRDIFSRILYGGRTSLLIAFLVTAIISVTGIVIGAVSGFCGGVVDGILMRISDMLMAFPGSIFTIALVSFMGTGLVNLIIAMSLTGWTYYARLSRSMVLSIKNNNYIEQARLGGANPIKVLNCYILPVIIPPLLVYISQDIGSKLLTIAGLSLLGLGSQPPTPEWGYMLSEGKEYMNSAPWMLLFPGIIILINVIVFNLLGDALQNVLNPKKSAI